MDIPTVEDRIPRVELSDQEFLRPSEEERSALTVHRSV